MDFLLHHPAAVVKKIAVKTHDRVRRCVITRVGVFVSFVGWAGNAPCPCAALRRAGFALPILRRRDRDLMHLHRYRDRRVIAQGHQHFRDAGAAVGSQQGGATAVTGRAPVPMNSAAVISRVASSSRGRTRNGSRSETGGDKQGQNSTIPGGRRCAHCAGQGKAERTGIRTHRLWPRPLSRHPNLRRAT